MQGGQNLQNSSHRGKKDPNDVVKIALKSFFSTETLAIFNWFVWA